MRKMGSGRGQVSAYPRQLESLIRLAEAHAKMRFSHKVEVADVQEARRCVRKIEYLIVTNEMFQLNTYTLIVAKLFIMLIEWIVHNLVFPVENSLLWPVEYLISIYEFNFGFWKY